MAERAITSRGVAQVQAAAADAHPQATLFGRQQCRDVARADAVAACRRRAGRARRLRRRRRSRTGLRWRPQTAGRLASCAKLTTPATVIGSSAAPTTGSIDVPAATSTRCGPPPKLPTQGRPTSPSAITAVMFMLRRPPAPSCASSRNGGSSTRRAQHARTPGADEDMMQAGRHAQQRLRGERCPALGPGRAGSASRCPKRGPPRSRRAACSSPTGARNRPRASRSAAAAHPRRRRGRPAVPSRRAGSITTSPPRVPTQSRPSAASCRANTSSSCRLPRVSAEGRQVDELRRVLRPSGRRRRRPCRSTSVPDRPPCTA